MSLQTVAAGFDDVVAVDYAASRDALVVAEGTGDVWLVDLSRRRGSRYEVRSLGGGYDAVTGVAVEAGGGAVVVADAAGLWAASLEGAGRDGATAFARRPQQPLRIGVMGLIEGGLGVLVLDGLPAPHLASYSLAPPPGLEARARSTALQDAVDAVPAPGDRSAYVLAKPPSGPVLVACDFLERTQAVAAQAPFVGALAWIDRGGGWLLVAARDATLAAVSRAGPVRLIETGEEAAEAVVAAAVTTDRRVLLSGATAVTEVRLPPGATAPAARQPDSS
jgi:hypothetical protein